MANNSGWIFIDETHYKDTKTGEIFEISRDSLKLDRIDENGTISEMIKTIDANFQNLAAHGGGPNGLPGKDGINGTDGTSAEYIFALCDDEPIAGENFPANDAGKANLFDGVEFSATGSVWFPSNSNKITEWHDHPQGVSKEHKNEYVFSRYRRSSDESIWFYAEKPELWAHWGETGKDGDGVEYIFLRSKGEISSSNLKNLIKTKSELDSVQSIIYQLDDFFPGSAWFRNSNNKLAARKAIIAKLDSLPGDFDEKWDGNYGMIAGNGSYNWSDDPKGTDAEYTHEYVSIRRCNVDDQDAKEWSDFSPAALWSVYSQSSTTIIIYCNTTDETVTAPQRGEGHWDSGSRTLTLPERLTSSGWSDTNENARPNEITWLCSGLFDNSGNNVYWSKPMRITGKDGKQGEDGLNTEFIYILSNSMPEYPNPATNYNDAEKLFNHVEDEPTGRVPATNAKYYDDAYGQRWYDRAQPISAENHTEYIWARRRDSETSRWEYDPEPIIWAHWGEDGTDGDGVEYIFYITETNEFNSENDPPKISEVGTTTDLDKCKHLIYNIDDFVPNSAWFNDTNKAKVIKSIEDKGSAAGITVADFETIWNNQVSNRTYFGFNKGWKDNPIKVDGLNPYQWVSIRRSTADEDTGGKRLWEDFSDPVLWSSYGKTTRTFIVYCNVSEGVTPKRPVGGYWNVNASDGVILALNEANKTTPFTSDATNTVTPEDRESYINVWEDDNIDVRGTITWMSSGIFSDDGTLIGTWSAPFRITGYKGENGADGSNIEFIYALCDEIPKYPKTTDSGVLDTFFDDVNDVDNKGYWPQNDELNGQLWTDNPTGISDEPGHRTEWVWSRSLAIGGSESESVWVYAPKPTIWSRWGEDGTDGDGVEYIFFATTNKPLLDGTGGNHCSQLPPKVSEIPEDTNRNKQKRLIYNISDFYPNVSWFLDEKRNTKEEIYEVLLNGDCGISSQEDFDRLWKTEVIDDNDVIGPCFDFNVGMCNPGDLGWTDNPSDVDFEHPYEYVSIRKTVNDPESGKKIWGDFSDPKIWGTYNMKTRMFVVYCNLNEGETPTKPENGWWDVESDKLLTDKVGFKLSPRDENDKSIWKDNTVDEPGKIAYLSSGMFSENGQNIFWSEPFRITGEKGRPGADGSTIEFVYCLSDEMPRFPKPQNYNECISFFEEVDTNNSAYYPETGDNKSFWTDNPRGISNEDGKRTEWVWSRSLANGSSESEDNLDWSFPPKPVIWSHWGEDGTDGDGVEYIFILTNDKTIWPSEGESSYATKLDNWNTFWSEFLGGDYSNTISSDVINAIYSMDDFIPSTTWFTAEHKGAVEEILGYSIDDDWSDIQTILSANIKITWKDNPGSVSPTNKYQYVSIRKTTNDPESEKKIWGPFSYPALWGKYNITTLKSFAFTSTKMYDDISSATPSGGTYTNPIPSDTTYNGTRYVWTDGPTSTDEKPLVWMTFATFDEENPNNPVSPGWSSPKKMTDSSEFQVEWSAEITTDNLTNLIDSLKSDDYNFGNFLKATEYDHDKAEIAWRYVVKNGYTPGRTYPPESYLTGSSFTKSITALGLEFSDSSNGAALMATCQLVSGSWSNWKLVRVKGEQGDPGTGINPKGVIVYECYMGENTTYTLNYASREFNISNDKDQTIADGKLAIVYPKEPNDNEIYYGDSSMGGALCMKKKVNGEWVNYYDEDVVSSNENRGDTYTSPNGHLIMWDGDSWQDIGRLTGPAGPVTKILIKFATDSTESGKTYTFVDDDDIPNAKYIGFLTYPDDLQSCRAFDDPDIIKSTAETDEPYWIWTPFHGQDGFGYEFIYKATSENNAPALPIEPSGGNWSTTPNIIPSSTNTSHANYGWKDEPIEPTKDLKYVWMCWRKYDHSTRKWTKFTGKDGKVSGQSGAVARLWQVYAKSINVVNEYFYAATVSSPSWSSLGDRSTSSSIDTTFWKSRANVTWNKTNRYLFNREVVVYSDNTMSVLDPHLVATYEDGILDVVDYYILESENGTDGHDPGDVAPKMWSNGTTPITTPPQLEDEEIAGEDYWTIGPVPKMRKEYPVLWNISLKTYEDNRAGVWTTPLVIGTYGEGTNGEDAIYADLDNEMDSIQIDEDKTILTNGEYTTTVRLYGGPTMMRIDDIDISGEEAIMQNGYTLTYYYDDGTKKIDGTANLTQKGVVNFTYNSSTHNFTPTTTDPIGTVSLNINCIKITFRVSKGDTLNDVYSKVVISVGHSEGSYETARRGVSYTFVGTTHPYVYSIVPKHSAIVFSNNTCTPNPLFVEVKRQAGTEKESFDTYASNQGFDLTYTITHSGSTTNASTLSSGSFKVSTSTLEPGDYITFAVNVDNDEDPSNGKETALDRETVYVLQEGEPGEPGSDGTPGNGYQYRYGRYDTQTMSTVSCSITNVNSSIPTFWFGNVSVSPTDHPLGVETNYPYEYRSERFGYGISTASTWSSWSDPVLIGKYIDTAEISTAVSNEVSRIRGDLENSIASNLENTMVTASQFASYIDPSTHQFIGTISDSTKAALLAGYLQEDSLSGKVDTLLNGYVVDSTGTGAFSTFIKETGGGLTAVSQRLNSVEGSLTQYVTDSDLSDVTTAVQTLRADAHDRFGEINSTVANATFATDDEGYLLVDMPIYTTWYPIGTQLHDPDGRRNVEWVLFKNSSINNILAPLVKNEEDYYNGTTKTKRVVVLYKDISYSSISNYIGNSTFTDNLMSIIIRLKKLGNDFEFRNSPDGINKYDEATTPTATLNSGQVRLIIYTTVTIAYGTQIDEYLEFSMCEWKVGVGKIGSNVPNVSLAHTVTGSVFEEPLLNSDIFSKVNANLYSSSGYILYKDEDNTVKEVDTNDKVTITSSYPFKVIKETNGANTLTKEQLKNALTKGIYYDISDYVLTAGNEMTYTIDVSANSTYYIAFNYSGTKTISYNLSNYGCSRITFNDDYIIDQSIMYDIVIKPSKLTLGTEGMYDWGRSPITIKENKTIYSGIDYSDFFQKSVTFIDLSVSQKDTAITLKMTTDTPSNIGNYKYLILNHIFTERDINNIFNDANEVANNITVDGNVKVSPNYFYTQYNNSTGQKGFLNNSNYGTENKTWNSWATPITINFNDGKSSNDGRYHITLVQYYWDGYSTSQLTSNFRNKIEITGYSVDTSSGSSKKFWEGTNIINTTDGTATRTSTEMYYTLDKLTVTHQAAAPLVPSNVRRKARNTDAINNPGVKAYIDVYDIDKPYLITSVTELATISQTVSDGIACTEIITGAGSNSAAAVFQATPDGSSINFLADTVGIESSHFKLNKTDGLWMDGDINVRSLTTNSGNTQITEDGTLYAKNAIIEGNITANNFLATTSYENSDFKVTKTAVMNAEKFEVASNAINVASGNTESAKIYITVLDELDLSDASLDQECVFIKNSGSIVTNIPTLCFDYNGKTYYLNPEMWWQYQPQQAVDNWSTTDVYYTYASTIYSYVNFHKGSSLYYEDITNNLTVYNYDVFQYNSYVTRNTGNLYVFGYSTGTLTNDNGDLDNLRGALTSKGLLVSGKNIHALNVDTALQHIRTQPINPRNDFAMLNPYSDARLTYSNIYKIVYGSDIGGYYNNFGYAFDNSNTHTNSIPQTILNQFNQSILNYIKTSVFTTEAGWSWTEDYGDKASEPYVYVQGINPFDQYKGVDGGISGEINITVDGAYKTSYTNGILDTTTSGGVDAFAECTYNILMYLDDTTKYSASVTPSGEYWPRTVYLKTISVKVTFGVYLKNISGDPKTAISNAIKNTSISNMDAIHVEGGMDFDDGSHYTGIAYTNNS